MSLLREKVKQVSRSLFPVLALVLVLNFTLIRTETDVIFRFLLGSFLLLVGLGIFLLGVDLGMNPMGEEMAKEIATSKGVFKAAALSFLLGFLVTVAEPDLLILGNQVQAASGGGINAQTMVYLVSIGVGVMVLFATFRLLKGRSYPFFMGMAYLAIFGLSLFVSEEFLAVSFDSSGATTGALTTPFVLALSLGLSRMKGGKSSEEDSFGMVGAMSAGPIFALMLMSILTGQKNIQGEMAPFMMEKGVLGPMIRQLYPVFKESLMALAPIVVLFLGFNAFRFRLSIRKLARILQGLVYILIGLTLFLTGVYSGFLDMGRIIGETLASDHAWLLPIVGFLVGMIVVLVEPAVLVLGQQIEETTGGRIPGTIIKVTLSIGVALAIMSSMIRILVPEVKLWYFLLPGFLTAVILSFYSDPIFVGIAYDAGGVASGPMTATFVLSFAQGAASMTPTANVLVDGFGVIAMVAMAPVLSLMVVGAVLKYQSGRLPEVETEIAAPAETLLSHVEFYDCVICIMNRGLGDKAIEIARNLGIGSATVIHGRGSGGHDIKVFNIELQKEKEIVLWLVDTRLSWRLADRLYRQLDLEGAGGGFVYLLPSGVMGINAPIETNLDS